ncbi:hypothetical protein BU202_09310 [Streptococcus cuniculi]|uniref:Uncharacterized protein n=1 Tax=Streptococcus cuniculi TaxID=1432788 RepID=A0A1Q8E5Q6_9STRE|nr:hypothetical protein BU202_09310 [Streptococcus cuniculi]
MILFLGGADGSDFLRSKIIQWIILARAQKQRSEDNRFLRNHDFCPSPSFYHSEKYLMRLASLAKIEKSNVELAGLLNLFK